MVVTLLLRQRTKGRDIFGDGVSNAWRAGHAFDRLIGLSEPNASVEILRSPLWSERGQRARSDTPAFAACGLQAAVPQASAVASHLGVECGRQTTDLSTQGSIMGILSNILGKLFSSSHADNATTPAPSSNPAAPAASPSTPTPAGPSASPATAAAPQPMAQVDVEQQLDAMVASSGEKLNWKTWRFQDRSATRGY